MIHYISTMRRVSELEARSRLYRISSELTGRYGCEFQNKYGAYPGVETPITPDEPDVLDAGDVVEGLGVGGLELSIPEISGQVRSVNANPQLLECR